MKKIFLYFFMAASVIACSEDDAAEPETTTQQNNGSTSCGEKMICFELSDSSYTANVGMYKLNDTSYFAKYEGNGKQLSIDWFTDSARTGIFPATDVKKKGMSRIYWFPVNNEQWMSKSGQVEITKHEGKTVSATFNGTLFKLVNGQFTTDSVVVKNGVFTNGTYW